MKAVSVSELKAHLSRYLQEVRRGGEVQVLDRGTPVARLVPLGGGAKNGAKQDYALRERLIAVGIVRPGRGFTRALLDTSPLPYDVDLSGALADDREDRM